MFSVITALPKEDLPPKFLVLFDEYERVQEGDDLTLACTFTGYPLPDVTWTMNNKPVENGTVTSEVRLVDDVSYTCPFIYSIRSGYLPLPSNK